MNQDILSVNQPQTIHKFTRGHDGLAPRHRLDELQRHATSNEDRKGKHRTLVHEAAGIYNSAEHFDILHGSEFRRNIIWHVRTSDAECGVLESGPERVEIPALRETLPLAN